MTTTTATTTTAATSAFDPKSIQGATELEATFVDRWHAAVAARDLPALTAMLAPGVVFESPAMFRPYSGKAMVGFILGLVSQSMPDLHYTNGFSNGRGGVVLHFAATVQEGEKALNTDGVDIIELDANGKVAKLTVMIRPLRPLQALAISIKASFEAARGGS